MIGKEGKDILEGHTCSLGMLISSGWYLEDGTLLSGQTLTNWLVLTCPMLPEMDWEAFQSVRLSRVDSFKHLMVVGVCEYEALNSLHELRIVILE